jgi:uncharacterized protein (DUF1778 family)
VPRKPEAGLRWISIQTSQEDYEVLKEAARQDRRSLTMFLRIALGELASELVFKNLVQQTKEREEREKAAAIAAPQAPSEAAASGSTTASAEGNKETTS